jgi:hypothetical protein
MTPEAVLRMSFPVANDPAFHFPMASWDHIRLLLVHIERTSAIKDRAKNGERCLSIDFTLVSCIYN